MIIRAQHFENYATKNVSFQLNLTIKTIVKLSGRNIFRDRDFIVMIFF